MSTNLLFFFAVAVGVLSVARTARLIAFDDYPPMVWLRDRLDKATGWDPRVQKGWGKLFHCGFCAAPYLALGMTIWTLAVAPWDNPTDAWSADWWWFVINGTWGLAYVASIIVAHDEPV